MIRLFRTFDIFYRSNFEIFTLISTSFYIKPLFKINNLKIVFKSIKVFIIAFFYSLKTKNFQKFGILMLISIFMMLALINLRRVFPYIFPFTSQISMVASIPLLVWTSVILIQTIKRPKNFISHFIPIGTPYSLIPLLFLIEIVRNLIRPLTASVRLVANILAGHLLIILLSKMALGRTQYRAAYIALNRVEIAVALIQSYIFCTMMALYYSEIR